MAASGRERVACALTTTKGAGPESQGAKVWTGRPRYPQHCVRRVSASGEAPSRCACRRSGRRSRKPSRWSGAFADPFYGCLSRPALAQSPTSRPTATRRSSPHWPPVWCLRPAAFVVRTRTPGLRRRAGARLLCGRPCEHEPAHRTRCGSGRVAPDHHECHWLRGTGRPSPRGRAYRPAPHVRRWHLGRKPAASHPPHHANATPASRLAPLSR